MTNVELLRTMLSRAVEEPEAYFGLLADDVVWDLRDTASPEAGVYHGRDAVRDFYRRWAGAFSDWNFEIDEMIDAGDSVVTFVTEHGHGRGSGVEVEMKRANVTTFRDGMVVHFRTFSRREDALEAAGLDAGNAERLRRAFESWNAKDIDRTLTDVAEDVRWHTGGLFPDFSDVYEGKDGVRRFFEHFMEPWEWISVEILELRELGDELVVKVRFCAQSHEGVDVDMTLGQRYRFRDGLVFLFHGHVSFEEALEAARSDA